MSVVTNVILVIPILEDEDARLADVNAYDFGQPGFVSVDSQGFRYGGHKALETNISIGAFNYLDLGALIDHLRTISWEDPENVQLIVQEQNEDCFCIIHPMWGHRRIIS